MAWIKQISPEEDPRLKTIYEKTRARTKEDVANVLKVHSINPPVLSAHLKLYETVMFAEGALDKDLREMIGVVVSKANECPYCVHHHATALFKITGDKTRMRRIAADYKTAGLSEKELALCDYAVKLTTTSYKMVYEDIKRLEDLGFNDAAIFEANQVAAYFNYVNRIVNGLGVETETI